MLATAFGYWLLIVSSARGDAGGLYLAKLDIQSQQITLVQHIKDGVNRPGFARFTQDGKQLFVTDNRGGFPGSKSGALVAYEFDRKLGKLTRQSRTPTLGRGPCYVGLTSNLALIANYGQGNVAAIGHDVSGVIDQGAAMNHSGSSVNARRQKSPHPHSFVPSPDEKFALSADLGTDEIWVYPIDKKTIKPVTHKIKMTPGAGPRHLAFSQEGSLLFVINELDNTLASLTWDKATGKAKLVDTQSSLPKHFSGRNSSADIHVHPTLPLVYTSNRGHNSIAVFAFEKSGKLHLVTNVSTAGKHPRGFTLTPDGKFMLVANRDTNNVVLFSINPKTGIPTNLNQDFEVQSPQCISPLPPEVFSSRASAVGSH